MRRPYKKRAKKKVLKKRIPTKRKLKKIIPSFTELRIGKFLRSLDIKYKSEYTHSTLVNPLTKCRLRLDFYLPEYNLAIEYDGKHHFENKDKKELHRQIYRDNIKNSWCQINSVPLLRINSTDFLKFEKVILQFIKRHS